MPMSRHTRAKGTKRARRVLGPDAQILEYSAGVVGPDPRKTRAYIIVGEFAVLALSLLLLHAGIAPGALIFILIYNAVDKPTAVVRLPQGVVLLNRNWLTGSPHSHAGTLTLDQINEAAGETSGSYVYVAAAKLWLKQSEFVRLTSV